MPENIQRSRGRPSNYKFDRGGQPAEFGPYIGTVKNNVDPTRSGRLQVYIEQFAGDDPNDSSLWRTVSYIPPFYGVTPRNNATGDTTGPGSYEGNQQSYGMWFTPPDVGVQVICFFVAGDPNQGYYLGCVPEPGVTHMIPAIGASRTFKTQTPAQQAQTSFANGQQLPVVEINQDNPTLTQNPRFFAQIKPVHSVVFASLSNQGLLSDYIRGPISSSAQRESPSSVFGMITPGRPIYQAAGLTEDQVKSRLDSGSVNLADVRVEGRRGGHSLVMDDGDLQGRDNLIRLRSALGHQITMSDEAQCFYFIHSNGQTWLEFGAEGTVDIYSTNSVNVRSQGQINLHADKDININAGENLNVRAKNIHIESQDTLKITSVNDFTAYSKTRIGLRSDGSINLDAARGSWKNAGGLVLRGSRIDLNSGTADPVNPPKPIVEFKLDDTKFVADLGWQVQKDKLVTIVTRAPTHEPYPYHNRGVPVKVDLAAPAAAPASPAVSSAIAKSADVPVASPAAPVPGSPGGVGAVTPTTSGVAAATGAASAAAAQAQQKVTTAVGSAGKAVGIDAAGVLKTAAADIAVGSLDKSQVTGLLAQAKTAVNQAANVISVDKGIGQYGFNPQQLEASGLVKPGTVSQLQNIDPGLPSAADIAEAARINAGGGDITPEQVARNRKTNEFLSSPFAWTGKGGVSDLGGLLNNSTAQDKLQQGLLNNSLTGLQNAGLLSGKEPALDLGAMVQSATKFGVDAVEGFVKGIAPPDVQGLISSTIKSAQFATSFVTNKLGDFAGITRTADAVANTVDRGAIDATLAQTLGNPKIPPLNSKPLPRGDNPVSAALGNLGTTTSGALGAGVSAGTKDEDLTYTGDDPIVWDRINAERLRRGLPGLAALGFPRPQD